MEDFFGFSFYWKNKFFVCDYLIYYAGVYSLEYPIGVLGEHFFSKTI